MKHTVLVFPCGSEIGLEIHRSLSFSTHFNLIGGSSVDDHGAFVYKHYFGGLPRVDEPNFIEAINELVRQQKIDFIFPAHDSVVLALAEAQAAGALACKVVTSPLETCQVARSKQKTYAKLQDTLLTPKVYEPQTLSNDDLPVFLKPDVGQGSKGTFLAKTPKDVAFYREKDPTLLTLEYLPGKEYTVDCFTDKSGKLLFCEGRERRRILNGISVNTASVNDERFAELARKINEALTFRGVWFFQVKENAQKEFVLMEIAPRVAGAMALIRAKGVNLVLLSLFDALGYDVTIIENQYQIVVDRALENRYQHNLTYQHVYLDFDDLVILNGQVNPLVMAFVYQCLNRGIKVHLLTRHKDVLEDSLAKYRLQNIFEDLTLVKDGEEKHQYITESEAIFIDDSFAERQKVQAARHIPTFDAHMLECLLEVAV